MPTYTCLCCEHTETFESADAAFQAGWDVAPHFTIQPLCDLCTSSPVALEGLEGARARHAKLHAAWQRDGRPKQFDVGVELAVDGVTDAEVEVQKAQIEMIKQHLLESNSHRVENDLKDRTRGSRRWLEGQIRGRLTAALRSAERGLVAASEKQHLSESEVHGNLARLTTLRDELVLLTRSSTEPQRS